MIKGAKMAARSVMVALALALCVGSAHGADRCGHCPRCTGEQGADLGAKTVGAFAGTAQSAAGGAATIAETSVTNTAAAPLTAVQAVKDTANTAFEKTDAAIKAFTGEDS